MWDEVVREPNGVGKQQQAGNYDLFDLHCLAKVANRTCNGVAVYRSQAPVEVDRGQPLFSRSGAQKQQKQDHSALSELLAKLVSWV